MQDQKLSYISLFSGAGVGCFGFALENFECIATCELLEKRIQIQKYNNKCKYPTGYITGDLQDENTKKQIFSEIERWRHEQNIKDISLIVATPPCQGMSVANHKKRNEMTRNSLVIESIKIVDTVKPKFFIFENVKTFLNTICTDKDNRVKTIKDAIDSNLSGNYNILYKVINFKDYGVPSSRTRTLIIGVRKDLKDISPYDIFPKKQNEITLSEAIGDLPRLKKMGQIDKNDIFHSFREYDKRMESWIKGLKEGESAFANKDPKRIPHKILGNEIIYNKNGNADKYRRCFWNRPGACIHTRNDILASQSTIHPEDNRVFSIRELMRMMSIPDNFKWSDVPEEKLNNMSESEKRAFLSKSELNIRQSIGEAVPTRTFQTIGKNIKEFLLNNKLDKKSIKLLISEHSLTDPKRLLEFIKDNINKYNFTELSKLSELANSQRLKNAAYYTSQDICFTIVNDLPDAKYFNRIDILEPSVGSGNFIPLIVEKYREIPEVNIDLVDKDKDTLEIMKILLKKLDIPSNIKINIINADFLLHRFEKNYDIVVGNPPFQKITKNKRLLNIYKTGAYNKETNNIFSFFVEKALRIGKVVAFISPKSLLSTPEFNKTRELLKKRGIAKITDYGEKAFNIKIETVSFITSDSQTNLVKIESYITNKTFYREQPYIFSEQFPYWLIYRDYLFDRIKDKMTFGVFDVFRDRQITKKIMKEKGKYRVLRAKNLLKTGDVISLDSYDRYIDNISELQVKKFLNMEKVFIVPNLSYYPRAAILPRNSVPDGSLALLIPKRDVSISKKDLEYFSGKEFEKFYRITRNYGTRSLNIDKNSVFFWGLRNNGN